MWEEFIANRAKHNVDELCASYEFPEHTKVMEIYARNYYGVDKTGYPIFIDVGGKANPRDVYKITNEERYMAFIYHDYERALKHRFLAMSHIT